MTDTPCPPAARPARSTTSATAATTGRGSGARHAIRSLFSHSLRSTYGIGRGGRAKIAPIILGVLALLPAVAIIGVLRPRRALRRAGERAVRGELADPLRHDVHAAVHGRRSSGCSAPRRRRSCSGATSATGSSSLYFARALRRTDYALARILGFVVALLILQLLPQVAPVPRPGPAGTDVVDGVSGGPPVGPADPRPGAAHRPALRRPRR